MPAWRRDEAGRPFALIITKLGKAAMAALGDRQPAHAAGKPPALSSGSDVAPSREATPSQSEQTERSAPRQGTKLAAVIALLSRRRRREDRGAHLGDGVAAAHHARGADRVAQARLYNRTRALGTGRLALPDRRQRCTGSRGVRQWTSRNCGGRRKRLPPRRSKMSSNASPRSASTTSARCG